MRRLVCLVTSIAALWGAACPQTADAFGWRRRCGGCSDTCMGYAPAPGPTCAAPPSVCLDTGPQTQMHVVLVPTYVTEKQAVCTTEYREEQRQRVVCSYKSVPVNEERVRVYTVPVSKTETKTIEYTVQVPVQSTQTKTYKMKVPVWTEEQEKYTVMVPVIKEIQEEYCVNVPVLREVAFNYNVNVPYPVTNTVNKTVSTAVPVMKTRTVSYCVPTTKTRVCTVDRGHWENRVEHVPSGPIQAPPQGAAVQAPSKGSEKGSEKQVPGGPGQVVCHQVWVPNVINEEVSEVVSQPQTAEVQYLVYEQQYNTVPYQCVCIEYRPESRTGTKKEVTYQKEVRTRPRTIVEYQKETRTRPKKVLTFKEEERTETYPVVTYKPEKRTKEVSYTVCVPESRTETYTVTRCDQVPENKIENYTTRVCVPVTKEIEVQVCRMVPKVVSVTVQPCPTGCEENIPSTGKGPGPQQAPPTKGSLTSISDPSPPKCCGG